MLEFLYVLFEQSLLLAHMWLTVLSFSRLVTLAIVLNFSIVSCFIEIALFF